MSQRVETSIYPSFAKEGWLRLQENGPLPSTAQTGWLFKATALIGGLKQPPRPLLKGCFAAFSLGRVHPSFAKEGYMLCAISSLASTHLLARSRQAESV